MELKATAGMSKSSETGDGKCHPFRRLIRQRQEDVANQ